MAHPGLLAANVTVASSSKRSSPFRRPILPRDFFTRVHPDVKYRRYPRHRSSSGFLARVEYGIWNEHSNPASPQRHHFVLGTRIAIVPEPNPCHPTAVLAGGLSDRRLSNSRKLGTYVLYTFHHMVRQVTLSGVLILNPDVVWRVVNTSHAHLCDERAPCSVSYTLDRTNHVAPGGGT